MASAVVLHIPHSSRTIPAKIRPALLLDDDELASEALCMTDHQTDRLFQAACPEARSVRFGVSRLVVDPERFDDDTREPMAACGMGVIYERTSQGGLLRQPPGKDEREALLRRWYRPHHARLEAAVAQIVNDCGHALVVDCHSYPRDPLPYDDQARPRPELCVGTDPFHTPTWLSEAVIRAAEMTGIEAKRDTPFAGALVPTAYHTRDRRVFALMLEVRRDMYLDEASGQLGPGFERCCGALGQLVRVAAAAIRNRTD